jgi:hypothetical protein
MSRPPAVAISADLNPSDDIFSAVDNVTLKRAAYAALFIASFAVALKMSGPGSWQFWFFAIAPDLTFLIAGGPGLEKGQINPRAVPYYNSAHSLIGPALLASATIALGLPAVWTGGALAWAAHIAADRALGFGPRGKDGFQRGAAS